MGKTYDLIILGGGPAGYFAAERAAEGGLSVCVFEERNLGGVCLNEGCIPTKSLLYSAKIFDNTRHGADYGVTAENVSLDHEKVLARKAKTVKSLVAGVAGALKRLKVDVIAERAQITGKTDGKFTVEAAGQTSTGDRLLIAAGSEAVLPPIPGLKEGFGSGFVLTSREALDIPAVPKELAVIGGGVIGLELANYFALAGSKVTVVEMLPEVGGSIDADVARILRGNLEKIGLTFLLSAKAKEIGDGFLIVASPDGTETKINADKILLSIGRRASTDGLGLEKIGVLTERGAVVTDPYLRTNVPGVWAAGDINGKSMLAHTAYREAMAAVNDILGKPDPVRYDAIPQVIYTMPEAAGVGETEKSAAEKGIAYEVHQLPLLYSGRYLAETGGGDGICKLLIEKGTRRLLGAHLIGNYASEIILSPAILVGSAWPADTLKKIVFPHPTVGEILRDVLLEVK
ncbi:dihydrolipoyl dehydrogenase [Clostridia bacterium]|nr:dihydrolipoyl dehydrogenase [Clostridia bacterium]